MDRCDELLQKAWEGELVGRVFFAGLAANAPEDASLWNVMAALESATAAMIAPVADAHGLSIDERAHIEEGEALVAHSSGIERDGLLAGTLAVIPGYLAMYQELATLLPRDEVWLADELVDHEQALERALDGLLRDDPEWAAAIVEYLARRGVQADQPA